MSKGSSRGTNILTVVLVVFVTLKLCKVITWPWMWVLIPLWIELALIVLVALVLAIIKVTRPWW